VVRKWHLPSKEPSLVNRLRRFLSNNRLSVQACYRPVAQQLVSIFAGHTIRLVIDCTKVGFNHQVMVVAIAYRRRTLPLAWSVHRGAKGNVAVADQMTLLRYVKTLLPPKSKVWLVGESGFRNVPVLRWARTQGWPYVIRQTGYVMVSWSGQSWVRLESLGLEEGETRIIGWARLTRKNNYG